MPTKGSLTRTANRLELNGDFNYDGKINIDVYIILDSNIPAQGDPL